MSMEPQMFKAKASPKLFLWVAAVGLLGCITAAIQDKAQFVFSYLTAFVFFLALALGGLFFVLIHHLTRAGWSVVVRRLSEHVMYNLTWCWILLIPVAALGLHDLFHWTHAEAVAADPILQKKAPYLNLVFFGIRTVVFVGMWAWMARYFWGKSVAQDKTGDKSLTLSMQKASTYGIVLFALSLTFFAVDWIMSLQAHWFSTIFGIYYFASAAVGIMALLILVAYRLQQVGLLQAVNVEHYHDLGKLLFGFNIFWTYIAFSQWMLIWYANLGEETPFYLMRSQGNWKTFSIMLPIVHFAIPFLYLLSRNVKRRVPALCLGALWLLGAVYIDIFWLIMPNHNTQGVVFGLGDISSILFIGGLFFYMLVKRMEKSSLIPVKDPRLQESLHFTNA